MHPMAGREKGGYQMSLSNLFENKKLLYTNYTASSIQKLEKVIQSGFILTQRPEPHNAWHTSIWVELQNCTQRETLKKNIPFTTQPIISGLILDKLGTKTIRSTTIKNGVKIILREPKECWATGKPINIPQII